MIRRLERKDIQACVELCELNFKIEDYSYDVRKELAQSFNDNQFIKPEYFIYEEDGIIKGLAGFSETGFDNGVFGLFTCYVHPEYQKTGIGRKLTEKRIELIKNKNGDVIFSTTKKKWHLERFGFIEIKSPYKEWSIMQLILS